MKSAPIIYRAAVIGAGPAGLACVGNLLDRLPPQSRILWIDPEFKAGRLDRYPAVPSNTKVCLFTKFARECLSFEAEKCAQTLKALDSLDQQSGCEIKLAGDLCKELTGHLQRNSNVHSVKSIVTELERNNGLCWNIKTEENEIFQSNLIFLTTGSQPKNLQMSIPAISLDDALNPSLLNSKVSSSQIIAVYGSSHSAMLVLNNLLSIPNSPRLIINYYRAPIKFAQFPDPINYPDRILHDNTGLKGETAEWVRSWIEIGPEEAFKGKLKRIKTDGRKGDEHGQNVDCNIYAVGYERNLLPKIIENNNILLSNDIDYTSNGQLTTKNSSDPITGLFGYGIAFPERVKDLDGSDEMAVGMWKFMKHIKKSIYQIINKE